LPVFLGEEIMKYLEILLCLGVILINITGMNDMSAAWAAGPFNTDEHGLAIKGYDPVAYFKQEKSLKGSGEFTYRWSGAKWRFVSAEHLELFKSDPEKYAPQYGGY
jgi:YHS domain-containing protein